MQELTIITSVFNSLLLFLLTYYHFKEQSQGIILSSSNEYIKKQIEEIYAKVERLEIKLDQAYKYYSEIKARLER
jgi:hypothetical protein